MRHLMNVMEGWTWNTIRDGQHLTDNPAFQAWFEGSKCVTSDGHPMMMFHASMSNDIEEFIPEKIRDIDLDAPFNGFWFSSDPETQPAYCAMDKLICIPVFLAIKNPASWEVWRKVVREVNAERSAVYDEEEGAMNPVRQGARSTHDEVRYRLIDMGYDGIVWEAPPQIDRDAFTRDGQFEYRDVRGIPHRIERGSYEETTWEDYDEPFFEVYMYEESHGMEKARITAPQSVLQDILKLIGWWEYEGDDKPDWSRYDMDAMEGEVTLGDKTVKVKKFERTRKTNRQIKTGNVLDTVELYNKNGHVTGYKDLDEFMDFHKHQIWVAFNPTQIKSAYNKGTWNPASPKLTEDDSE